MDNNQQAEQIRDLCERAAGALRNEQVDEALHHLSEAIALNPGDQKLITVRDAILGGTEKNEKLAEALSLLQSGNLVESGNKENDEQSLTREPQASADRRKETEEIQAEANRLISEGKHERAVALVEEKLKQLPSQELTAIVQSVRAAAEQQKSKISEAVGKAQRFLRDAQFSACVDFLNSLPEPLLRDAALKDVSQSVIHEQRRARTIRTTKEKIREALSRQDFPGAEAALKDCEQTCGDSMELKLARGDLESKWAAHANRCVAKALADARMLLMGRSFREALNVLGTVAPYVSHASDEIKKQYEDQRTVCQGGIEKEQKAAEQRRAAMAAAMNATVILTPSEAQATLKSKGAIAPGATVILPVEGSQGRIARKPIVTRLKQILGRRDIVWGVVAVVVLVGATVTLVVTRARSAPILVAISTMPQGATIRVDQQSCTTPGCMLRLTRGQHTLEAQLAGYERGMVPLAISAADRKKGKVEITVQLKPLAHLLQISSNFGEGRVQLDGAEAGALQNGSFLLEPLGFGKHRIRVSAGEDQIDFPVDARPGAAPVPDGPANAVDVRILAISTSPEETALVCNCTIDAVSIDDHSLGQLTSAGLRDGRLNVGAHTLSATQGTLREKFTFEVRQQPAITLLLTSKRNTGTLVIVAGVPNAEIFVDGTKYSSGRDGVLQLPVEATEHAVRVRKRGYELPPDQRVVVKKNQETRLVFRLQIKRSTVTISGAAADTHIRVDDTLVGLVHADGSVKFETIAGKHVIAFERPGYLSVTIETQLMPGQELQLSAPEMRPVTPR